MKVSYYIKQTDGVSFREKLLSESYTDSLAVYDQVHIAGIVARVVDIEVVGRSELKAVCVEVKDGI